MKTLTKILLLSVLSLYFMTAANAQTIRDTSLDGASYGGGWWELIETDYLGNEWVCTYRKPKSDFSGYHIRQIISKDVCPRYI